MIILFSLLIFALAFIYLVPGILFAFWLWEDRLHQPSYRAPFKYHLRVGILLTANAVLWPLGVFYWRIIHGFRFDRPWIDNTKE